MKGADLPGQLLDAGTAGNGVDLKILRVFYFSSVGGIVAGVTRAVVTGVAAGVGEG